MTPKRKSASFISKIIGVSTLNKDKTLATARDDSSTGQGFLILVIVALIQAVLSYLYPGMMMEYVENMKHLPGMPATTLNAVATQLLNAIITALVIFLTVIIFSFCYAIFLRLFGGDVSTMNLARILAFLQPLSLVISVVIMFTHIGILALIPFIWLLIEATYFEGVNIIESIISFILGFILFMILFIIVLGLLLIALIALLVILIP